MARNLRRKSKQTAAKATPPAVPAAQPTTDVSALDHLKGEAVVAVADAAVVAATEPSPNGDVTLEAPPAAELAENAGTDQPFDQVEGETVEAVVEDNVALNAPLAEDLTLQAGDNNYPETVEVRDVGNVELNAPLATELATDTGRAPDGTDQPEAAAEAPARTLVRRFGGKGDHDGDGRDGGAAPAKRVVTEAADLGGGVKREKSLHELNLEARAFDRREAATREAALRAAQAVYREMTGEELPLNPVMPHPVAPAVSQAVSPLAAPVVPPPVKKE